MLTGDINSVLYVSDIEVRAFSSFVVYSISYYSYSYNSPRREFLPDVAACPCNQGSELHADVRITGQGVTAALEAQMPFMFGPPYVDKPSKELLAELQLAAGRNKEAAEAYRAALARTPGRAMSLAGLATAQRY